MSAMPDLLYREMSLDSVPAIESDEKSVTMTFSASSEYPVMRQGYSEVLRHDDISVRLDRLKTTGPLLVNHDRDSRAGMVAEAKIENRKLIVTVRFGTTQAAINFRQEVEDGTLRGVSIGYNVFEWEVDESTRTYTAIDWEPFETSLVSIPADPEVGIGRGLSEEPTHNWRDLAGNVHFKERADMPENKPALDNEGKELLDQAQRDLAKVTAEKEAIERESGLRSMAMEFGIDAKDVDFSSFDSVESGQRALMGMMADQRQSKPVENHPQNGVAVVTVEQHEKAERCVENWLMARTGFEQIESGNPLAGRGWIDAGKRHLSMLGVRNTDDWNRKDIAHYIIGDYRNISSQAMRSAPNIITASHSSFVGLDAITKIVAKGFEQGSSGSNYRQLVEMRNVPDFKNYNIGALGTGNLQQTAESEAFPELQKSEGVYSNNAKMWGGTLSLSIQALINDDVGEYERSLRQAGVIADKTVNKRVFEKLLLGLGATSVDYSNNTTVGAIGYTTADGAYGARTLLDGVIAAQVQKTGLDGNPLGNQPRFIVVPPALLGQARGIANGVVAPGQQTVQVAGEGGLIVVSTPWIGSASPLTGNSDTSYYLLSDPNEVTGLCVSMINGFETPQVTQYDAGAVAAVNHKIWLPFEADAVYLANSAGTNTFAGIQRGTAS